LRTDIEAVAAELGSPAGVGIDLGACPSVLAGTTKAALEAQTPA